MYDIKEMRSVDWFREYINHYEQSERIRAACGSPEAISLEATRFYMFEDERGGFALSPEGELLALHSTIKGDGNVLVFEAIQRGAISLNCFDIPHLVNLYERHGFKEVKRECNWVDGGLDVIYMEKD